MTDQTEPTYEDREPVDTSITHPPEYATPLIYAFGRAVLHWGDLEATVDTFLIATHAESGGRKIPNGWTAKCEQLEARCAKPRFAAFQVSAVALTADLKTMGGQRNLVVHAGPTGYSPGPPALLHLRKLTFLAGDQIRFSDLRVTDEKLYDFCDEIIRLKARLLPMMLATGTASSPLVQ